MNRIDVGSVPEVFRRHNLKPISGAWVGDIANHECCILTALYCDASGCQDAEACLKEVREKEHGKVAWPSFLLLPELVANRIGVTTEYVEGVFRGWDEIDLSAGFVASQSDEWKAGYQDGVAASQQFDEIPEYADPIDGDDEDDIIDLDDESEPEEHE